MAIYLCSPHQLAKPAAGRSMQLVKKTVELSLLYRLFASRYYKSQGNLPITTLKIKLSRQDPSQQQHKRQLILANCIVCSADTTFFYRQTDLIYIVFETVRWKKSIDLLPEPTQFSTLIELARRAKPYG